MEEREDGNGEERSQEREGLQEEHKKKKKKDEVIEELQRSLEAKEGYIKALQDKILYLQADFENYKKLKVKEKQDLLKFGNEVLIKDMLPVVDNLQMALDHSAMTEDFKAIYEGVKITLSEFLKVFEKAGVTRIDAVGKRFDPNLHEALFQEENDEQEPDTVVSELQKGYMLNGRLLRPSRVSVSKKPDVD